MFGVSFLEIAVIGLVALIVVGPQKLPSMMRTAGEWMSKLRNLTTQVRAQTGIDEILREEGIDGVRELRSMLRGQSTMFNSPRSPVHHNNPLVSARPAEPALEFPVEGADCSNALAEDLIDDLSSPLESSASTAQTTAAEPAAANPDLPPSETALPEPTAAVAETTATESAAANPDLPAPSETESKSAS